MLGAGQQTLEDMMDPDELAKAAEEFLNAHETLMETHDSYGLYLKSNALRKALRMWKERKR